MKFAKVQAVLLLCLTASDGMAEVDRSGAAARAAETAAAHAPADVRGRASEAEVRKGKKVCRGLAVTGSRFRQKVCHTQAEWDEIEFAHKEKMRDIDRQPVGYREP